MNFYMDLYKIKIIMSLTDMHRIMMAESR